MIYYVNFRRNIFLPWLVLFVFISIHATGQVIDDKVYNQIVVKADSVVLLGKQLRLQYEYNTKDPSEKIVSPIWNWDKNKHNYEILLGPNHSSNQSYSHINGKTEESYGETFTFILSFSKEGIYTLPPMIAKTTSGKELLSKSIVVRATKRPVLSTNSLEAQNGKLFVLEASVNKNQIKLGDSVICELRLYTNLIVTQLSSSTMPINHSYWKEFNLPNQKSFEKVKYKGDSVRSVLWQKFSIVPFQSGKLIVEPIKLRARVIYQNRNEDPFEAFFSGKSPFIEKDTLVISNPITIQVDNNQLLDGDLQLEAITSSNSLGLMIDRSSSLLAMPDSLSASFLQMENEFVDKFMKNKYNSNFSVTFFAGKPHFPTSLELSDIQKVMPSKENDGSAVYNTILACALRDGAITGSQNPYSILLLTDGYDNASYLSEKTVTNLLLQHKIRVDVVAFASRKDSIYSVSDDITGGRMIKNEQNFADVERIAKSTNGMFVLVEKEKDISDALRKIREQLRKKGILQLQPEKGFAPNKSMLNSLYNRILRDARTDF